MTTIICAACGQPFEVWDVIAKRGRKFCSMKCRNSAPPESRFWSKVDKSDHPKGCWIWVGARLKAGYGYFWFQKKRQLTHRVSFIFSNGNVPQGLDVLHKCDNPSCVNPDHLFLGTQIDNSKDMVNKGRCNPPAGERAAISKLNREQVLNIRQIWKVGGYSKRDIAATYDVHYMTIHAIITRRSWNHLPDEPLKPQPILQ